MTLSVTPKFIWWTLWIVNLVIFHPLDASFQVKVFIARHTFSLCSVISARFAWTIVWGDSVYLLRDLCTHIDCSSSGPQMILMSPEEETDTDRIEARTQSTAASSAPNSTLTFRVFLPFGRLTQRLTWRPASLHREKPLESSYVT